MIKFCFVRFCFITGLYGALIVGCSVVSFAEANTLLVSNAPERLEGPITLFSYQMPLHKTLRILYHHKNVSAVPLNFTIVAKSVSKKGKMSMLLASAGPAADEIFAGHKAVERYWEQSTQKRQVLSVDKNEIFLINVLIQPGDVVSGIFECESDVEMSFEGRVIDPLYPEASYLASSRVATAQIYAAPSMIRHVSYVVGDVLGEIPVGAAPFIRDEISSDALKGNYGVLYKFHVALENPDVVPRTVSLLFSPLGGVARAIIRVSGKTLYQTGNVGGGGFPSVVEVLTVKMPPKSKKELVFEAIPQSGSYYPVHFVLRSEGPSSSASRRNSVDVQHLVLGKNEILATAMDGGLLQESVDNGY